MACVEQPELERWDRASAGHATEQSWERVPLLAGCSSTSKVPRLLKSQWRRLEALLADSG